MVLAIYMEKQGLHNFAQQVNGFKNSVYYCYCTYVLRISRYSGFLWVVPTNTGIFLRDLKLRDTTSFPGSLLFTPQEAREGRPWLGLVTCLPKSGRLQISDWREGRLSVSLPILSVPGMGKHASVRINLQNRACFKVHVKWSRNS